MFPFVASSLIHKLFFGNVCLISKYLGFSQISFCCFDNLVVVREILCMISVHLNSNVKSLRLVLWMSCGLSYKLLHVYFKRMRFLFLLVTFLHVLKSIWFIAVFMSSIFLVTFCLFFYQLLREE